MNYTQLLERLYPEERQLCHSTNTRKKRGEKKEKEQKLNPRAKPAPDLCSHLTGTQHGGGIVAVERGSRMWRRGENGEKREKIRKIKKKK